jgi:zinc-binding dehydrogenase
MDKVRSSTAAVASSAVLMGFLLGVMAANLFRAYHPKIRSPMAYIAPQPLRGIDDALAVETYVDSNGRIQNYRVLSAGKVSTPQIKNMLIFTIFRPATFMGMPTSRTATLVLSHAAKHNINQYINLLKRDGTLAFVGAPSEPLPLEIAGLLFGRKKIAGSMIGGIRETQEMLDFCSEHNVVADIEMIGLQQINQAFERLLKNDVRYRVRDRFGIAEVTDHKRTSSAFRTE